MRSPAIAVLLIGLLFSTAVASPAAAATEEVSGEGLVLINELANGGSRSDSDTFFELRNWGDTAVDLTGWQVFRCSAQGLRSNVGRPEGDMAGVILEPGQIFTVSKIGMQGDAHISSPFMTGGFGLYLENPSDDLVDAVGVYPNEPWPTQSECTRGANLPNSLAYAFDESWQRISPSEFVKAPATIGTENASSAPLAASTGVVISEFAPSGPDSTDDEFVELWNLGASSEDIGGWQLYRCTATGRLRGDTLQATIPAGTALEPGGFYVIAANAYKGDADARYGTGFADVTAGAYLRTADGLRADGIAVSSYPDSACQSGDEKLPAVLDHVNAESYQFTSKGFVVAKRTPGAPAGRAPAVDPPFEYGDVAISEFATDPSVGDLPAGSTQHNYIELGNYGSKPVDLSGWTIRRCEATGIRSRQLQLTVADGTVLKPGDTWIAAKDGTGLAADATYPSAFNFLGSGAWVENASGDRVDSVGVYAMNEMDESNVTWSPCSKGMPLTTYQPDRWLGETFQRTRFTGVDADDFVTAPATPGEIDELLWVDPTLRVEAEPVVIEAPVVEVPILPATAHTAEVLAAWGGASSAPLKTKENDAETALDPRFIDDVADNSFKFPYVRLELDASALDDGSRVYWSGSGAGRSELQLSVWGGEGWRLLDAASGPEIRLGGAITAAEITDGRVTLLVQAGPRTEATLATKSDGQLQQPENYDLAISHITDTQYLSESYPEVYAQLVSWIADNVDARKIEFVTHTGDLVQNWVDPDQSTERATVEFERASAMQSILDEAAIPNSVLPGNHDSKRGVDYSLFNEYFGPERYAGTEWYGAPIAPGDNSSNYSTFEHDGARFLMLSLGYAYGDREIAWAADVVASHLDYNVIISTHEHVTPKTSYEDAHVSANSRWVSRGQDLWDKVIAPNRTVILVLSGHFHGLGQIRTENAGGITGHTVVELLADYQEFRTHTGERATGFQRLLQLDLASGTVAVDTFSVRLDAVSSFEYDYKQFVPDTGLSTSASNERPWRIVEAGVQGRYTADDDEFTATVAFQYPKLIATDALDVAPPAPTPGATPSARAPTFGGVFHVRT